MEAEQNKLTHFDENGRAVMVDVGGKAVTARTAVASGMISMSRRAFELVRDGGMKKGDVLGVARIAGIMAAKRTDELVPLTHPLMISKLAVEFELDEAENAVIIAATAGIHGQTGVEMEALTAVSVAALTIYDMCKAVDKSMVISNIRLLKKSGGKSGLYMRDEKLT